MLGRFLESFYSNFMRPLINIGLIIFSIVVAILLITSFLDTGDKKERIRIFVIGIFFMIFMIFCFIFFN